MGLVCIPLYQVVASVVQAVGGSSLDAVQPMHAGWYIYMQIQADQEQLIQKGIVVAGKLIILHSESTP